jgi:hypothetical protein
MPDKKYAICIDNSEYAASLEFRKIYELVPDTKAANRQQLRVVDESGEDYLYPAECFIEISLPKDAQEAIQNVA